MEQLGKLRELLTDEEKKEIEILAVSPDPRDKLKTAVEKIQAKSPGAVSYRLLSDSDHRVIDRYGLRNEAAAANGRFIPHPTTYIIDQKGKVAWRFTEKDYKIRPQNEVVRAALRK